MLALERSGVAVTRPLAPSAVLQCAADGVERTVSGGHGGGETPVPIPNTAVKPARADGTWGEAPWESRSPPGFLRQKPLEFARGAFVVHRIVVHTAAYVGSGAAGDTGYP